MFNCNPKQYWSSPLHANNRIISFTMNNKETPPCIHSLNIKTGVIESLHEFKYPSHFHCNKDCRFAYNPSNSEIFILTEDMEIIKVNLITKQWSYCGDGPDEQQPFDNCLFIKNNDIHMICPYFGEAHHHQNDIQIESLNYLIFDKEEKVFAEVGTNRDEPLVFSYWDEHVVLPLATSQEDAVLLINKTNMEMTEFKGDTVQRISFSACVPRAPQHLPENTSWSPSWNAWNGAVITSDNKIALIFELWKAPNCEFINIFDIQKRRIRKSAIKAPMVHPFITTPGQHEGHIISAYYFQALIVPNRNEVSLIVNGYYRRLTTENKLIPTMPLHILQLIMMFHCAEKVFLLHTCQKRFCYAIIYLDEILNSTHQDDRTINFKYATR